MRDATYLDDSTANYTPEPYACEHCSETIDAPGACADCAELVEVKRHCTSKMREHEANAARLDRRAAEAHGFEREALKALADSEWAMSRHWLAKRRAAVASMDDRLEEAALCRQLEASLHVVREAAEAAE